MIVHAINTHTTGISEYTGLSLLGLTTIDDRLFGITATGLLEFTGTTDEGSAIVARVRTGKLDFGSPELKIVSNVYVRGTVPSGTLVKLTSALDGTERSYTLSRYSGDDKTSYTKTGRGVRSPQWMFEVTNAAGGDFGLEFLGPVVHQYTRRVGVV